MNAKKILVITVNPNAKIGDKIKLTDSKKIIGEGTLLSSPVKVYHDEDDFGSIGIASFNAKVEITLF